MSKIKYLLVIFIVLGLNGCKNEVKNEETKVIKTSELKHGFFMDSGTRLHRAKRRTVRSSVEVETASWFNRKHSFWVNTEYAVLIGDFAFIDGQFKPLDEELKYSYLKSKQKLSAFSKVKNVSAGKNSGEFITFNKAKSSCLYYRGFYSIGISDGVLNGAGEIIGDAALRFKACSKNKSLFTDEFVKDFIATVEVKF